MKDNKLIQMLRTFSKEEMKQLEKFIASPYHNNGKNCLPLFKQLSRTYPHFTGETIVYENLYKKLYPGKKFNKQVMWNLASAMEKLLTEFLIQQRLNKNKFEKHVQLIEEYLDRKLFSLSTKEIQKLENYVHEQKIDSAFFSRLAAVEDYKKDHNLSIDKQHLVCENVLHKGESLILSFLMTLSGVISDLDANYRMYNARYNFNIPYEFIKNLNLNQVLEYMKKHGYEHTYIVELYYYIILIITEPENEDNFHNLKRIFGENHNKLTFQEKHVISGIMVNFCTAHSQTPGIREILFDLNNYRLKESLVFYPGNHIPKIVFIQMLINALSLNEIKWSEDFIESCAPRLNPENRDAMHALANAYLHAALKQYDKVLDFLNKVEYVDVRDKIHVKLLTAKAYYELDQTETLRNFIDSTRHFIKSNSGLNKLRQNVYGNFLNYLQKTVTLKENPDKAQIHLVKKEILELKEIPAKKWLNEKLDELLKISPARN
jgi:hypothetical protein